jgi:hypothetical protein
MKMQAVEVLLPVPRAVSAALIVLYVPPLPTVKHPLGGLVRVVLLANLTSGEAFATVLSPKILETNVDNEKRIVTSNIEPGVVD